MGGFEAFCDLYDTFNWFYSLLKKAETSYDNTTHKSN